MSTLAEIENAVTKLPDTQQAELLYFLAARLGDGAFPVPEPREFTPEQLEKWMDEDEAGMRRFREGA
ncbi:MAG: hypothetical protein ABIP20_19270 [Chthoniobacteraceae bacterium]